MHGNTFQSDEKRGAFNTLVEGYGSTVILIGLSMDTACIGIGPARIQIGVARLIIDE
jgi:hypothetical protein